MREKIVAALGDADFVFVIGAPAFTYHVEGFGPHVPEGAALAQLIDDPMTASWTPLGIAAIGSLKLGLADLLARPAPRARAAPAGARRQRRASSRRAADDRLRDADARRNAPRRFDHRRGGAERAAETAAPSADRDRRKAITRWTAAGSASACRRRSAIALGKPGKRDRRHHRRRLEPLFDSGAVERRATWACRSASSFSTTAAMRALKEFAPAFGFGAAGAGTGHGYAGTSITSRWRAASAAGRRGQPTRRALRRR